MEFELKKEDWGPGPWQDEPDRMEFEHAGLPCLLVRNTHVTGSWCGYAAVSPGHPFYGKHYSDEDGPESKIDVHGGLTYSGKCQGNICHVPKPGESDNVWWFGFDCAHIGDVGPLMNATIRLISKEPAAFRGGLLFGGDTYKDINYAKAETKRLAEQLAAMPRKTRSSRRYAGSVCQQRKNGKGQ